MSNFLFYIIVFYGIFYKGMIYYIQEGFQHESYYIKIQKILNLFISQKALLIIREKVLLLMFVNSEPLKNFCWNMGLHGMMS